MRAGFHRWADPAWRATWLALRPWNRVSLTVTTLGVLYIALGIVWATNPATPSRRAQLALLLDWTHGHWWPLSAAWIITGVAAVISSRWPPTNALWGFPTLGALAALWSTQSLIGGFVYGTWSIALPGALVWGGFAFLIWVISGLRAPVIPPEHHDIEG